MAPFRQAGMLRNNIIQVAGYDLKRRPQLYVYEEKGTRFLLTHGRIIALRTVNRVDTFEADKSSARFLLTFEKCLTAPYTHLVDVGCLHGRVAHSTKVIFNISE